jgi:indole-3-glycerol phosphate synthase/phosphoribosylanthranilate isomerase
VLEPFGVLGRIAAAKREELARRFDGVALDELRAKAEPTTRSLAAALRQPGARFILEIKKASPSAGAIRADADPAALARGYAGVADALSVLCDGPHFGGSLADLSSARVEFGGPILAKDFFIDLRQVAEARIAGADAILVMLSLLEDAEAQAMIAEAKRFGMDALVEVHDLAEMRRALTLDAPLIGINNRDLRDLTIDLRTTERLARLAPDRVLVSESGIADRADVARLAPLVDAFLIGSSLMRSHEPGQAARELIFGRVKICGLNSGVPLHAARPAAFTGFVFAPGSPRHVSVDEAGPLAQTSRSFGQRPVGIFRDVALAEVASAARGASLHAVQLHGDYGAADVRALRKSLSDNCEIWTALSVGRDKLTPRGGDRLLFDNGDGGTGRGFDWSLIENHPDLPRALVAGGIGANNAKEAQQLGAYAIDLCSSVEERPGLKSLEKVAALFETLRPTARERVLECA